MPTESWKNGEWKTEKQIYTMKITRSEAATSVCQMLATKFFISPFGESGASVGTDKSSEEEGSGERGGAGGLFTGAGAGG